jgi:hypothetical protein
MDSAANLEQWGAVERASLFISEFLQRFDVLAANHHAVLRHIEPQPDGRTAEYKDVLTITRPDADVFKAQLDLINNYTDLRGERTAEILAQLGPPAPSFSPIVFLDAQRKKWTVELMFAVLRTTYFVVMRIKHAMACRRPHEYSPQLQPIIPTPLHSAYPSGHATESFVAATVLRRLLQAGGLAPYTEPGVAEQLMAQAERIAINRTVAGVHFPIDSAAGAAFGLTLGDYLVSRCSGGTGYEPWQFDGQSYPADRDFALEDVFNVHDQTRAQRDRFSVPGERQTFAASGHSKILKWLWGKAAAEWE